MGEFLFSCFYLLAIKYQIYGLQLHQKTYRCVGVYQVSDFGLRKRILFYDRSTIRNHPIGKYYNCNKHDSSAFELEQVEYSISTEINCIFYNLYTVLQFNRIAHLYVILILIRNIGSYAQFIYWLIIFVECTNRTLYSYP